MDYRLKLTSTILLLFFTFIGTAQDTLTVEKANLKRLKIYADENALDYNYLREKIKFADFVNDPLSADVQMIIVEEITGSGGINYSIRFNSKTFKNILDFTLNIQTIPDETVHNRRNLLTNTIIRGLMPFFNETPESGNYQLSVEKIEKTEGRDDILNDKWKNWVFRISSTGGFDYEESKSGYNYSFKLYGDKVTEKLKINNYIYLKNEATQYDNVDYVYRYNYKYAFTKGVYSLSDHWSTGLTIFSIQSSYYNKRFSITSLGAIEYNLFPWNESNEHVLSIAYAAGFEKLYFYNKNYLGNFKESLLLHRLYVEVSNIKPWGKIAINISGSEYLNDLSLYNISLGANLSYRIIKGLSLTFDLLAVNNHDQIYIPENSYTIEQIISGATKLPTTFELNGSVGLTLQFGSIYNNVVNRRL